MPINTNRFWANYFHSVVGKLFRWG